MIGKESRSSRKRGIIFLAVGVRGCVLSKDLLFRGMKLTSEALKGRKTRGGHAPVCAITAYDYPTARLVDEVGVDVILVGDSLGMVVLGYPDTTHVTVAHMVHHIQAVARGASGSLILGDLPYKSYDTVDLAVETAQALVEAGADMVKLEGGREMQEQIRAILKAGVPVVGHLGMLPQSVKEEGGYKKKGKTDEQVRGLVADAQCLDELGCCAVILESVVPRVARLLTEVVSVPTIGIGCGRVSCDGEVAVITDVVGAYPWFVPPFAVPRANVARDIKEAVREYKAAIGGCATDDDSR